MMRKCLFALALTLATLPAYAGSLAGVSMADSTTTGDHQLVLNGMALRSKLIFKVYVAGLYLPTKQSDAGQVLAADGVRHLVMRFTRKVTAKQVCEGWYEGLEANTPNPPAALRKEFDTLCTWMEDVRAEDQYAFTYIPGEGTEVTVKGQSRGTIESKEFADALFACWIGPHPGPGEAFRQDLMGG